MTSTRSPVSVTIGLGLVFALLFIPMVQGFAILLPHPLPVRLTVWLYLAVYAMFLSRWGDAAGLWAAFPLFLMAVVQFAVGAQAAFWCLFLVTLCWLRSGVSFPDGPVKTSAKEALICGGGALLTAGFHPRSPAEWALAVWLFSLTQALFFVLFPGVLNRAARSVGTDPFEAARWAAERILRKGS